MSQKCEKCGGKMIPLLTSFVCETDCAPAQLELPWPAEYRPTLSWVPGWDEEETRP